MKKNKLDCALCKLEIDTKKEKYVHVEDWEREKMNKEIWCHLVCFNKGMNRELTEIERQAKAVLEQAPRILAMLPQQEQRYEI